MTGHRLFDLANLMLIAAAAYFAVSALYAVLLPASPPVSLRPPDFQMTRTITERKNRPLSAYRVIVERDLFKSRASVKTKPPRTIPEKMKQTELDLKLWGTVNGGPDQSFAVIEDPTVLAGRKKQKLYKAGDTVQDATLVKILRNRIILDVNGSNEILAIEDYRSRKGGYRPQSKIRRRPIKHRRFLRRKTIENAMRDVGRLMAELRVRPHSQGIMLSRVSSRSFFRKMGLRRGDIVTSVDGRRIYSADDILNAYNSLLSGKRFSIEYIRRGRKRITQYVLR